MQCPWFEDDKVARSLVEFTNGNLVGQTEVLVAEPHSLSLVQIASVFFVEQRVHSVDVVVRNTVPDTLSWSKINVSSSKS